MKFILAPDSFKGTITAVEACDIMGSEIRSVFPSCQIVSMPVADGGEGTIECFLRSAIGGEKVFLTICGPHFETIESYYGLINNGNTAIIETALAAGLPMVDNNKNPATTTTFGVGQMIQHAVDHGAKEIMVALGGSCTNDGGCGMACALGVKFLNAKNEEFIPLGGTLDQIVTIDAVKARKKFETIVFQALCDVNSPLTGEKGAAYVYAPQKGADSDMVRILDHNLTHLASILERVTGRSGISSYPGSGAAGGLGAMLLSIFNAEMISGVAAVLNACGFDNHLEGCDVIFTGEGRIDGQSLNGKVIAGITSRSYKKKVPVIVVAGDSVDEQLDSAKDCGITAIFTINRMAKPFSEMKLKTKENLRYTMRSILNTLAIQANF